MVGGTFVWGRFNGAGTLHRDGNRPRQRGSPELPDIPTSDDSVPLGSALFAAVAHLTLPGRYESSSQQDGVSSCRRGVADFSGPVAAGMEPGEISGHGQRRENRDARQVRPASASEVHESVDVDFLEPQPHRQTIHLPALLYRRTALQPFHSGCQ